MPQNVTDGFWSHLVDQPMNDPVEVPDHVDHADLYRIQVMQGRQIRDIWKKLNELEQSPVVLSGFQKAVLGVFLAASAWVLNTTHQNAVATSAALATLGEINKKVSNLPSEGELERRLETIENLHPRTEPK